ncbi:hypothetical protein BDK88_2110 [Natrinema hispanicum]|uniref:Uncharacterized protein n=1 Tax=Natrinema hispanicum TaxID=392421 RepID=A0A482Y840_9EURY|nr:hypothetical protein BDK88_2110 [Natrinema hispanicum]
MDEDSESIAVTLLLQMSLIPISRIIDKLEQPSTIMDTFDIASGFKDFKTIVNGISRIAGPVY